MTSLIPTAACLPIRSVDSIADAAPISAHPLSANGLSTDWVHIDPRASSQLWRSDMAHAPLRSLGVSLTWTAIVAPASPTPFQSSIPTMDVSHGQLKRTHSPKQAMQQAIDRLELKPAVRHLRSTEPAVDAPLGMVRQRFYPAQWQLAIRSRIESRVQASHQRVQWVGWDRSLPRMYLSAELLTQVFVDLIEVTLRNISGASGSEAPLSIRVAWQSGAAQRLVIVISHPHLQMTTDPMQATHNGSMPPSNLGEVFPNLEGWNRICECISALSGSLTTAKDHDGGMLLRLSIPTDDRLTMIDAWLQQVQAHQIPSGVAAEPQLRVGMYLLGWQRPASASTLAAIDGRLQALANRNDFVYRAAHSRWLWLTVNPRLPKFSSAEAWRTVRAQEWSVVNSQKSFESKSPDPRLELSKKIVAAMEHALGCRVPPLDDLTTSLQRLRLFRLDAPAVSLAEPKLAEPKPLGPPQPKSALRANRVHRKPMSPRRWRYPI